MSSTYTVLTDETRVMGLYHGVAFVGTIWSHHTDWHGRATYHVNLDHAILVNDREREGIAVTVKCDTLSDDEYGCLIRAI